MRERRSKLGHYHFPGLPGSASGLAVRNGFLYVLSPHGVFRADPTKLAPITLRAPERISTTLVGEDYEFNLPPRRPAPWASPVYQVRVNGRELELASHNVRVPRLPYGRTKIEVTESIAGLTSQQSIEVLRPRPWWISWQGGLVYVAITSCALWLLFRWRTRVLRLRAKHLEQLVEERTNDLKSALQARELFYSSISHEIRNPLNGVVGMCDILAERPFGGRDQMFVRTLKSCATQLQRLLDDLLDMTRVNRGRLVLRAEAFNLVQTVRNAAIAAEPTLATIEIDSPEELWVTGDPIRLQQVAYNLISNALKFGQPSRASVRLAVLAEGPGAKSLELVVRNSGPAISPAEREAIFEGFSRGAEAVKSGIPGMGLGLAVSRGIIVAMGGQLDFRRIGEVTEFFAVFELPYAEHATGKVEERVSFAARALAIEDEHYNRLVLGHTLARLGIEADWAPDVASARRAFAEQKYDVVITDYRLPDGDGVSLAREFSAIHGCPPIIMLTAYSTDEKRQAAHNAGVGAVLTKPLSESELVRSLREVGLTPKDPVSAAHVHGERELDFTRILALENGEGRLAEYCDEVERLLGELKAHASNSAVRERISHTMKGRLALVRAQAACELCEKIEAVVEVEALRSLLDRLTDAVTEVVRKGRDQRRTVSV